MKKAIPVLIAIFLILVIAGVTFGGKLYDKYSYSKERMDLNEYYELYSDTDMAILLHDTILSEKAQYIDGTVYFDINTVHQYLNERFYVNTAEGNLLYTTPTEIIRADFGADAYAVSHGVLGGADESFQEDYVIVFNQGDAVYVAADFVAKYSDFAWHAYTDPNRVQLYTETGMMQTTAQISKNTAVRYRGGVKSPILSDVEEGDTVIILEEMEEWSQVKTQDGFIGYVENKRLENIDTSEFVMTGNSGYVEPEFTSVRRDYKINLVWHQIYSEQDGSGLREAMSGTSGVNVVSPTWFSLSDNSGNFTSIANRNYVDTAHDMGLEVWALIDNFSENVASAELFASSGARKSLISNLMMAVEQYDLDGINIDFEQVSMQAGEHFVQFIRELSVDCRATGTVLSIDNYVPTDYTDHYNRAEQGLVADYVIIMGYDEHYAGGEIGSVASIGFVQGGIENTAAIVPQEKIINALPYYTRIWKTEGGNVTSEAVGMETAASILSKNGVQAQWDEETCQNYAEFQKDSVFYQVWLEDAYSIQAKLNIMQNYNLGGVAGWKLGLEAPYVWEMLGAYMGQ